MLETEPDKLDIADDKVFVKDNPEKSMSMTDVGVACNWGGGFLVGTGWWMPGHLSRPRSPRQAKWTRSAASALAAASWNSRWTRTPGEITLLKCAQTWEVGKAVNPLMCRMQINGGLQIGIGYALSENIYPYYPSEDFAPDNLGDYYMPTFADYPEEVKYDIAEVPHPNGGQGCQGFFRGLVQRPRPGHSQRPVRTPWGSGSPKCPSPRKWSCGPSKPRNNNPYGLNQPPAGPRARSKQRPVFRGAAFLGLVIIFRNRTGSQAATIHAVILHIIPG